MQALEARAQPRPERLAQMGASQGALRDRLRILTLAAAVVVVLHLRLVVAWQEEHRFQAARVAARVAEKTQVEHTPLAEPVPSNGPISQTPTLLVQQAARLILLA